MNYFRVELIINQYKQREENKSQKQKYFIDDWLQDEAFSDWLVKDKNDSTKARCSVCHKTIEFSFIGLSALTDHAKEMKHISAVNKVSTIFSVQNQ